MKYRYLFPMVSLLVFTCKQAPRGEEAVHGDPEKISAYDTTQTVLKVDTSASRIEWLGTKIGGSHAGEIRLNGGILNLKNGLPVSGVFTMNMNSIVNTDIPDVDPIPKMKLVQHLKGGDFFNVEEFPLSTFEITSVVAEEDKQKIKLSGNLTLRGVSRNITFMAEVEEDSADSFKAFASFNIDRKEWGISYKGLKDEMIHDQVNLKIYLQARKAV